MDRAKGTVVTTMNEDAIAITWDMPAKNKRLKVF